MSFVFIINDVYFSNMAKRSTGVGNNKTSRSDKTKKRIETKYIIFQTPHKTKNALKRFLFSIDLNNFYMYHVCRCNCKNKPIIVKVMHES
ncbi:MAG: hypothetical protein UU89_C0022G0004 [Parcubacteria group bacterium GW2011_GWC2_42_11]|nr:MAG: hypothetical protein UU89_C0022G0004 [Parcubacteria group bacterium GW2011_GWC2_42_11]